MSTTSSTGQHSGPVSEEPPASRSKAPQSPRVPRQHRGWLVVVAILVLAAAGGGNAWIVGRLDERVPMMVLTHDVAWQQPVTGQDVTTVYLSPEARTVGVSQDEWNHALVGQLAATPLHAGQLLSHSGLTSHPVPGPGRQVLGLRLAPGHYPARGLVPNDPIQVVALNPQASTDAGTSAVAGPGFPARVVRASGPDPDGALTADVLVDQIHAGEATSAAATGALVTLLGPTS